MADKWIPVRDSLPETEEWVQVQTQDGTVYPAFFKNNKWSPLFRGGLVEHLMHGKVAYWQPHDNGYPYVQCKCGNFYLQAEGRKECPICASFGLTEPKTDKKPKKTAKPAESEDVPFADMPVTAVADDDLII